VVALDVLIDAPIEEPIDAPIEEPIEEPIDERIDERIVSTIERNDPHASLAASASASCVGDRWARAVQCTATKEEEMNVADIMTEPAVTCMVTDDLHAATRALREHDLGALPVVDDAGALVGIVTDRDIC